MEFNIDKSKFVFKYLPEYADFLLKNKLEEFVKVGIRLARQFELPMMKALARFPEQDLIKLSMDSNRELLQSLRDNRAGDFIEKNTQSWIDNKISMIDKTDVAAEDLTLAFFIRRKLFAHFLYAYSPNPAIHQIITEEVDLYTSQEEVITVKAYLQIHRIEH